MQSPSFLTQILDARSLIEALEGVVWLTDAAGTIVAVGEGAWDAFALANGGDTVLSERVIGRRLFDFVTAGPVRSLYEAAHGETLAGQNRLAIDFRCDGPDVERRMRLALSRLTFADGKLGVLYQSQLLSEEARPPFGLLADSQKLAAYLADDRPVVVCCSFCGKVRPSHGARSWVTPERYYAQGGSSRVRLSHGICRVCERRTRRQVEGDSTGAASDSATRRARSAWR